MLVTYLRGEKMFFLRSKRLDENDIGLNPVSLAARGPGKRNEAKRKTRWNQKETTKMRGQGIRGSRPGSRPGGRPGGRLGGRPGGDVRPRQSGFSPRTGGAGNPGNDLYRRMEMAS